MVPPLRPSTAREVVLRPDAKGRVGLDALLRRSREFLGGAKIAGLAAEVHADGAIVLRPCVEIDAREANVLRLSEADAEAFVRALANPAKPKRHLRKARDRWAKDVSSR